MTGRPIARKGGFMPPPRVRTVTTDWTGADAKPRRKVSSSLWIRMWLTEKVPRGDYPWRMWSVFKRDKLAIDPTGKVPTYPSFYRTVRFLAQAGLVERSGTPDTEPREHADYDGAPIGTTADIREQVPEEWNAATFAQRGVWLQEIITGDIVIVDERVKTLQRQTWGELQAVLQENLEPKITNSIIAQDASVGPRLGFPETREDGVIVFAGVTTQIYIAVPEAQTIKRHGTREKMLEAWNNPRKAVYPASYARNIPRMGRRSRESREARKRSITRLRREIQQRERELIRLGARPSRRQLSAEETRQIKETREARAKSRSLEEERLTFLLDTPRVALQREFTQEGKITADQAVAIILRDEIARRAEDAAKRGRELSDRETKAIERLTRIFRIPATQVNTAIRAGKALGIMAREEEEEARRPSVSKELMSKRDALRMIEDIAAGAGREGRVLTEEERGTIARLETEFDLPGRLVGRSQAEGKERGEQEREKQ